MKMNASIIQHRGESRIKVSFEHDTVLNERITKIAGAKWSKTLKSWHVPDNEENRIRFKLITSTQKTSIIPLPEKSNVAVTVKPASVNNKDTHATPLVNKIPFKITKVNRRQYDLFLQHLRLKAYSASTIRTYCSEFSSFLALLGKNDATTFTTQRIKDYLEYCSKELKLSENTIHSRINALKFYYEQVLGREKFFFEVPRPKKQYILPKLLNEDELRRLFNALTNKKHKAMLFTAYSAGLRVSEIVNLKLSDIDSKRMQIFIARAKGKKDRYVNLSPVLLDILRQYLKTYTPRPKTYLFESEQTGEAYPARTIQQIFSLAKHKAGIKKDVGIHSLRHSFATHLLDKGTDIKYIKDILGHFNIKTTERYLHISKKKLVNIISPFDDLYREGGVEW